MHEYVKPQSDGKRILAGFLDIVFTIVLAILLFLPLEAISQPLGYGFYNEYKVELYATLIYSELYEVKDNTGVINLVTEPEKFPKALYNFYVDKRHPTTNELQRGFSPLLNPAKQNLSNSYNTAEDYYVFILQKDSEDTLFHFFNIDEERPWLLPVKDGNEAAAKAFYQEQFLRAHEQFGGHPRVILLNNKVNRIDFIKYVLAFYLAALLLVMIVPLFLDNYVTLGKKITKTAYLSEKGFKITRKQGLLRNGAMFIFGYLFFFMPFHLISLLLSVLTKSRRSIYDFFAATVVVTTNGSLFFADEHELKVYRKRFAQILIEQQKRKREVAEQERL